MKKILITLLTAFLLLGVTGCNSTVTDNTTNNEDVVPTAGKYPVDWDDTMYFKDEAAFFEYADNFEKKWTEVFKSYQGKLDTVDGLYGYISTLYGEEFNGDYDKMYSYVSFGVSAFPLEQKYINCESRLYSLREVIDESKSYFDSEMEQIPYEKRIELFSDEKLSEYTYLYYIYLNPDYKPLDSTLVDTYNNATISHGNMNKLRDTLVNFEMPVVEYKLKDGSIVELSDKTIDTVMASLDYDYETKKQMYDAWWKNVSQFKGTLALILETQMLEQYSDVKINGYESTRLAAEDSLYFEEDIIEKITGFARNNADLQAKLFELYKDEEGKYYTFSNRLTKSSFKPEYVPYDETVDNALDCLSILGDEYVNCLLEVVNSKQMDIYPKDNKTSGAFEMGTFVGVEPFLMFNYDGLYATSADIAHELGHACYEKLNHENQPIHTWGIDSFTHEVASIFNELNYYEYLIEHAETDDEKIYHLENLLYRWSKDMFECCCRQDFESYCHETVEAGGYLDGDDLSDTWDQLQHIYYGDNLNLGDYGKYRWITMPSTFNNYYNYKYATAICYATVLMQNIKNGVPGAKEGYLDMLKIGGTVTVAEALNMAGIDIYDDSVYEKAFNYYAEKVQELENFLKK